MTIFRKIEPLDDRETSISTDDVIEILSDLSGTYAASDLYERYCVLLQDQGRIPAHRNRLGSKLAALGFDSCVKKSKRAYRIPAHRVATLVNLRATEHQVRPRPRPIK